ncbi:putative phosphotransferase [Microbacterium aerolatum]|uniref:Putative phosphotransferase n=2 Tax=Microbacterium aerolatum TaxID=153731 RepID=A0A511AAR2_9MICO|nr:putative phosphotransferase [Microbacterium aerolatum]GGB38686.1 putative phosphotransferase [Microbacterium aerolatum]
MKMHDDELEIDEQTVRRLVDDQFPEWRSLAIRPVPGAGTVNAIFRMGEDYTARFPLTGEAGPIAETLRREAVALAELADACPVPAPRPVALGAPDMGHPLPWSIQTWIPGTVATPTSVSHSAEFAGDLVKLVEALRDVDTRGRAFGGIGRGGDLKDSDEWMATCFRQSTDLLPVDRLRALWERMRLLPGAGALAMTHGDLIPGNLLIREGRLAGVLDGGGFGPTDPSLDLVAGWHLLDADARAVFREGLGPDDLEWRRGAAWAFQQAMGLVWYYQHSNPPMSALGRSTLRRILDDDEIGAE